MLISLVITHLLRCQLTMKSGTQDYIYYEKEEDDDHDIRSMLKDTLLMLLLLCCKTALVEFFNL